MARTPTIPLSALHWEDCSEVEGAGTRMLAQINIGPLHMHLEAREVTYDDSEARLQTTVEYPGDHDAMCDIAGCAFETLDIGGREYFLFALPHGF